jgi:methylated-DNA-protein-cysteine methyltransferase-like protein
MPVSQKFAHAVYELVKQIPAGQVATYSQIGTYLGTPRLARPVGNALRELPRELAKEVPWQRVIKADGRVAIRGDATRPPLQVRLLKAEGIPVDKAWRIPLEIFQWHGPKKLPKADFSKNARLQA